MITWHLHPTEPDTWQVFSPWGHCIAAIRRDAGTNHWEGVIRPLPDDGYDGIKISGIPTREAAIAVIDRELAVYYWPDVTP